MIGLLEVMRVSPSVQEEASLHALDESWHLVLSLPLSSPFFFFHIMFHMLPSINRLTIFQILIWELSSQSLQLLKKLEDLHHLFKLPASRLRSLRVFPKLQAFHFLKRETQSWRTPQGLFSWIPMLGSLPSYLTLIC